MRYGAMGMVMVLMMQKTVMRSLAEMASTILTGSDSPGDRRLDCTASPVRWKLFPVLPEDRLRTSPGQRRDCCNVQQSLYFLSARCVVTAR